MLIARLARLPLPVLSPYYCPRDCTIGRQRRHRRAPPLADQSPPACHFKRFHDRVFCLRSRVVDSPYYRKIQYKPFNLVPDRIWKVLGRSRARSSACACGEDVSSLLAPGGNITKCRVPPNLRRRRRHHQPTDYPRKINRTGWCASEIVSRYHVRPAGTAN